VPKPKFKLIGMQFIDDEDPDDIVTGTVVSIVRHKKSRKLAYKYWDHNVLDQAPTVATLFEYIDVTYAMSHCKWSKFRPVALISAANRLERNQGPSRNSIRRARKRAKYVPWYHKLHLRATAGVHRLSRLHSP
jgi:coenzyme F420-reducing hydrogenase gamma subunit